MEKQFTTPVSMKVTEQQFKNDLEQPLLEMGYENYTLKFDGYEFIVNNSCNLLGKIANYKELHTNIKNRYHIEPYNPKLFLALAGMTNSPDGNVGEWWKCVGKWNSFDNSKLYKQLGTTKDNGLMFIDKSSNAHIVLRELRDDFIKATKEEIIEFFSEKETEVEQELIGYRFRNDEFNMMLRKYFNEGEYYPIIENDIHLIVECDGVDKLKELNILETFCEPVYAQKETPISYEEAIDKLNETSKVKKYYVWEADSKLSTYIAFKTTHPTIVIKHEQK